MAMKQCLIIDDSSSIRKVANRILKDFGYESREAGDSENALRLCEEKMPDFIIIDWQIPDADSNALLNTIRKFPDGDRPTIIFCTLENDPVQLAAAIRHGANGQLMKPFDRAAVEKSLSSVGLI